MFSFVLCMNGPEPIRDNSIIVYRLAPWLIHTREKRRRCIHGRRHGHCSSCSRTGVEGRGEGGERHTHTNTARTRTGAQRDNRTNSEENNVIKKKGIPTESRGNTEERFFRSRTQVDGTKKNLKRKERRRGFNTRCRYSVTKHSTHSQNAVTHAHARSHAVNPNGTPESTVLVAF